MTRQAPDAGAVARSIGRMRSLLRRGGGAVGADDPWWVLAVGEELDREDFAARDAARERLEQRVRRAGIALEERVWVWDETNRAQLKLLALPGREEAEALARALAGRGLKVRIRRTPDED